MTQRDFSAVRHWIFDLDNTLYPPAVRLFDQIEVKMTSYVARTLGVDAAEADALRARYWRDHGTTLAGLMQNHAIDPWPYLRDVHDISLDALTPEPELASAIAALPGRAIVYTNGDSEYAARVLAARGLSDVFDAVYGIDHTGWRPKPEAEAFAAVIEADGLAPEAAAMFEDDPRNLLVPHDLGMRTVHVAPVADPQPHIHFHTGDITAFVRALSQAPA